MKKIVCIFACIMTLALGGVRRLFMNVIVHRGEVVPCNE